MSMRFKLKEGRDLARSLSCIVTSKVDNHVVELLADQLLEACDEIDFHKQRRTFHDTLTLMQHDHTAKCLEAYRKAFSDLVEYTNECADFRNGVTDGGVDEGTVLASRFVSDLKYRLFMTETHQKVET